MVPPDQISKPVCPCRVCLCQQLHLHQYYHRSGDLYPTAADFSITRAQRISFFYKPSHAASSPRNAILGHGFGILVGWLAFMLFDNLDINPVLEQVGAVALSLGVISALMIAGDFPHPPAASTTLIVSMGMMIHWMELLALMAAVILLTVQAFVINRFSGIVYPVWRVKPGHEQDDMVATALETEAPLAQVDLYTNLADQLASRVEAKDLKKKK